MFFSLYTILSGVSKYWKLFTTPVSSFGSILVNINVPTHKTIKSVVIPINDLYSLNLSDNLIIFILLSIFFFSSVTHSNFTGCFSLLDIGISFTNVFAYDFSSFFPIFSNTISSAFNSISCLICLKQYHKPILNQCTIVITINILFNIKSFLLKCASSCINIYFRLSSSFFSISSVTNIFVLNKPYIQGTFLYSCFINFISFFIPICFLENSKISNIFLSFTSSFPIIFLKIILVII